MSLVLTATRACMAVLIYVSGVSTVAAQQAESPQSSAVSLPEPSVDQPSLTTIKLPVSTPVLVKLEEDLSTQTSVLGQTFKVTVVDDIMADGAVAIPMGTVGVGQVTFVTGKGVFGKPGILGISLRYLELNGKQVALDGRYREEGGNNNGATAAAMFAVGVFSAVITGKTSVIPQGRELKARTGEEIELVKNVATDVVEPVSTSMAVAAAPQP